MKLTVPIAGLAIVVMAGLVYVGLRPSKPASSPNGSPSLAHLAGQIDAIERQVVAIRGELAARQGHTTPRKIDTESHVCRIQIGGGGRDELFLYLSQSPLPPWAPPR